MGKRRAPVETYENDGGFVEDAPKSKKSKKDQKQARKSESKVMSNDSGPLKDQNGDLYWELSRTRRIGISEFKGNTMVNIREYYEKDGAMLPGKKGISLTLEQYSTMVSALPDVDAALAQKGEDVKTPDLKNEKKTKLAVDPLRDVEDDEEEEEHPVKADKQAVKSEDDDDRTEDEESDG